jgi:hypothetical protein
MNRNELYIVAKRNNQEIFLVAYTHEDGSGFVADLDEGVRYPDSNVQTIRKKGFWIDIQFGKNVENVILKKIAGLKAIEVHHP